MKLTQEEKQYLFSKVEYSKKKKLKEATEGKWKELYDLFYK